jgi:non-specific serine/threonine protein kinase
LTRREVEVAVLLAQGLPNSSVAKALYISPHTARRHTERVMAKLDVPARAQVAAAILADA